MTNNAPGFRLFALCVLLASATAPRVAAADDHTLLVYSAGRGPDRANPLWLVKVDPAGPDARSSIYYRDDVAWQEMPGLPARIAAITGMGREMVVMLMPGANGMSSWAWYSEERFSYGPALPSAAILAMAGDGGPEAQNKVVELWALGMPLSPTTEPASPRPATSPASAAATPVLFSLGASHWTAHPAPWPEDLSVRSSEDVSLTTIDGQPFVAASAGDGIIKVLKFSDNQWREVSRVQVTPTPWRTFKLLGVEGQPALWVQPLDGGIGGIWLPDSPYRKLELTGPPPKPGDIALTVIGNQFRLCYRVDKQFYEQRYGADGTPQDQPVELKFRTARSGSPIDWTSIAVLGVLAILILNTVLRRRNVPRDDDDRPDSEE